MDLVNFVRASKLSKSYEAQTLTQTWDVTQIWTCQILSLRAMAGFLLYLRFLGVCTRSVPCNFLYCVTYRTSPSRFVWSLLFRNYVGLLERERKVRVFDTMYNVCYFSECRSGCSVTTLN